MSIVTLPTGILFGVYQIAQQRYDLMEMSETSGAMATRLVAPPRWKLSIASPNPGLSQEQAALWKKLLLQLRGGINYLAAYDVVQQAPRGTMRGTLTLTAIAAAGATSISFSGGSGEAGKTILTGDLLQIGTGVGSHYCVATSDGTANGSGVITGLSIEPPTRVSFAIGTSIVWDKPVAYYKMTSGSNVWSYVPGTVNLMTGFGTEFLESFT
mgnify:CR=1 FL=1